MPVGAIIVLHPAETSRARRWNVRLKPDAYDRHLHPAHLRGGVPCRPRIALSRDSPAQETGLDLGEVGTNARSESGGEVLPADAGGEETSGQRAVEVEAARPGDRSGDGDGLM